LTAGPIAHPTRRLVVPRQLARPRARWTSSQPERGGASLAGAEPESEVTSDPLSASLPQPNYLPFRFETGLALFAKRAPRPFPPPFLSPPSGSFSDPLSTHHRSRDRRAFVDGALIQGWTNGDDAVFANDHFICANDGVGAWATRPRGHAGLWARLVLHFWATAVAEDAARPRAHGEGYTPDPVAYLQRAYEQTIRATSAPNDWQGTTTASGAQLHYRTGEDGGETPALYVTNLGDSQVMVVRPSRGEMVFKTSEQWHWFDCPRQLGTNSPDTPRDNAAVDVVALREGDVVLALSDGVIDNLWSHEIVENVSRSVERWEAGEGGRAAGGAEERRGGLNGGMTFVAGELMEAAKAIALDPFAESPFMEHAIEEGLASEGGRRFPCSLRHRGDGEWHGLTMFRQTRRHQRGRCSVHTEPRVNAPGSYPLAQTRAFGIPRSSFLVRS